MGTADKEKPYTNAAAQRLACYELATHQGRVVILLVASCHRTPHTCV